MLELHNPHSILAALETRPRDVLQVTPPPSLREGSGDDAWNRVLQLARKQKVAVVEASPADAGDRRGDKDRADRGERDRGERGERGGRGPQGGRGAAHRHSGPRPGAANRAAGEGGRVSPASALVKPRESLAIEELFSGARERREGKGLWLALDSLQDPHNVGAIFRTASFFGVEGIVLTEERSAPLSASAYDVASGGLEHVPFTIQVNLQRAFEKAKEAGLWILGTSEHANDDLAAIERDRPWLLVLGNEEKGMRRLTEEACDVLCKIPSQGKVGSLNVSVASGIFIAALSGGLARKPG